MTKTPSTYLATVGIYDIHRSDDATAYDLRDRSGVTLGTYATARQATDAGVALIAAAYRARKA